MEVLYQLSYVGAGSVSLARAWRPSFIRVRASGEDLARLLDDLDRRLRTALPEIGEVFVDVTAHRRG